MGPGVGRSLLHILAGFWVSDSQFTCLSICAEQMCAVVSYPPHEALCLYVKQSVRCLCVFDRNGCDLG